jgi:hypothetical protein
MIKRYINTIITMLSVAVVLFSSSAEVFAATTPPKAAPPPPPPNFGEALEIAPPVIYLSLNPGQTVKTQIFLRDISSGPLVVGGQANDFTAAGEDGTPKILLDNEDNNNPYSMKSWVVAPATLNLVPKEVKTMAITINVPKDASPGGHYGIIRFTATPPSLKSSGVSLSTSLGALMLVTVSQANITDMFGRKVGTVNINLPPRNILPQSTRKFEDSLDKSVIGKRRLFGHYSAKLTVTYGKDKKSLTSTLGFWIIPYRLIAIIIALLIAGFFALRFAIRRYNRFIIGQSGRRRRK